MIYVDRINIFNISILYFVNIFSSVYYYIKIDKIIGKPFFSLEENDGNNLDVISFHIISLNLIAHSQLQIQG